MSTSTLPKHISALRRNDVIAVTSPVKKEDGEAPPIAVRVRSVTDSAVVGELVRNAHFDTTHVEAPLSTVLANFGRNPPRIMVSGVDIGERFTVYESEHEVFGTIHWSYEPDADTLKRVMRGYTLAHRWLRANGLEGVTRLPVVHEITHVQRKFAGRVFPSTDLSKRPMRMQFTPSHATAGDGPLFFVVMHELAHVIDFSCLVPFSPKLRSKWVDMYTKTVNPCPVAPEVCKELLGMFVASENIRDFQARAGEEYKEEVKEIFATLARTRRMDKRELWSLMESERGSDAVAAVWPDPDHCVGNTKKPIVSDYATKNVRELIAESVAFHACGLKIPKSVTELVERSLQRAIKVLPSLVAELSTPSSQGDSE